MMFFTLKKKIGKEDEYPVQNDHFFDQVLSESSFSFPWQEMPVLSDLFTIFS